jgi:hypothetical protein
LKIVCFVLVVAVLNVVQPPSSVSQPGTPTPKGVRRIPDESKSVQVRLVRNDKGREKERCFTAKVEGSVPPAEQRYCGAQSIFDDAGFSTPVPDELYWLTVLEPADKASKAPVWTVLAISKTRPASVVAH